MGSELFGGVKFAKITRHGASALSELSDETNVQLEAQTELKTETRTKMKEHKKADNKRSNPHHDHVPNDEMDLLIEIINSNDLGWKADTCKLSKTHPLYGAHCDENINLAQTEFFSDYFDEKPALVETLAFGKGPEFSKALETAQQFQKKYSSAEQIPDGELPAQLDWRNFDGYDFTGKVRDQRACGSCYTVAFTQVVEARLKIKTGEDVPQISPQFLLSCNYMNEGCEGGWPHF